MNTAKTEYTCEQTSLLLTVRSYGAEVANGLNTSRDQINRRNGGSKRAVECVGLVTFEMGCMMKEPFLKINKTDLTV